MAGRSIGFSGNDIVLHRCESRTAAEHTRVAWRLTAAEVETLVTGHPPAQCVRWPRDLRCWVASVDRDHLSGCRTEAVQTRWQQPSSAASTPFPSPWIATRSA
jgi:hypothetical protein